MTSRSDLNEPIGIAITTYNRASLVCRLVETIRRLTVRPVRLVVCNDGSSDDTFDRLKELDVQIVTGKNKGIAWNKNRGLYFLMNHTTADKFILLDDDVIPDTFGWEEEWFQAISLYGHVNHAFFTMDESTIGAKLYTASSPGLNGLLSGVAIGISRAVVSEIGYMDTRFGKYGHEHTEYTMRALSRGFGGLLAPEPYFVSIRGGIRWVSVPSHGSVEEANANYDVHISIRGEHCYRLPWRSDTEYEELMVEMRTNGAMPTRFNRQSAQDYIKNNPDLACGPAEGFAHWLNFGRLEGRKWPG